MSVSRIAGLFLAVAVSVLTPAPATAGWDEAHAAYERGDYHAAFREFMALAVAGDSSAQLNIGFMYVSGQGVPQNYAEAMRWYRMAADAAPPTAAADPESEGTGARPWERYAKERRIEGTGTGFAVSRDGHIVTNHHVVAECAEVRVRPAGQDAMAGAVVARDAGNDLALLKAPVRLPVAEIGDARGIRAGDSLWCIAAWIAWHASAYEQSIGCNAWKALDPRDNGRPTEPRPDHPLPKHRS